MKWQEVCEHQSLKDLPFRIELNEKGQILMTPVKVYHSAFQGKISRLLPEKGVVLTECAVKTDKGTRVADIAWASEERYKVIEHEDECSIAPEICIEVISASNTKQEIDEKWELFILAGASEFWLCDEGGKLSFFDHQGRIALSKQVPDFPRQVKILV